MSRVSGGRDEARIRRAVPADLEAICAIFNREVELATSTFETEPWSVDERRAWLEAHETPKHPILVAEAASGAVVAWACLSPWSPKGGYAGAVEASVFVDRGRRGEGIGTRLLKELVGRAERAGHRVILGRVEAANDASRRLLGRLGFASVGVMHAVGRKHGRILDVELYERLLPAARRGP